MEIEVIRSSRRIKTVQAHKSGNKIVISIPALMTKAEEELWVSVLTRRIEQKYSQAINLKDRAKYLCSKYDLVEPNSIGWVNNQNTRWDSCSIETKKIRISSRIKSFPLWVLDYVIVHELAHLVIPSHNSQFWQLVNRYPKTERSIGFLIAKSS